MSFSAVLNNRSLQDNAASEVIEFRAPSASELVVERNVDEVLTTESLLSSNFFLELSNLKSHIQRDSELKKSYTLNYVGSVNNCHLKDIDVSVLDAYENYKNDYFDKYYNKLNTDFNVFYNKSKNKESIDDFITNSIFKNDEVFNNINDGVTSLASNFKSYSLFEEIKNIVTTENYSSNLFGQLTSKAFKNIAISDKSKKLSYVFDFPQKQSIVTSNSILNKDIAKEKLMFEIFEDNYNFNVSNKPNATVIIVQCFLNTARSLYTLHPNSLDNVINKELKVTFSETVSSYVDRVISNEYKDCDFYRFINEEENYFNISSFLKENNTVLSTYEPKLQTNGVILDDYLPADTLNPRYVVNNTVTRNDESIVELDNKYDQDASSGRINALKQDGNNSDLIPLINIFDNELQPGQYYYPRSFLDYLGRQTFALYKTKELFKDLEIRGAGSERRNARSAFRKYNSGNLNYFKGLIDLILDNSYSADFSEVLISDFRRLIKTYFLKENALTTPGVLTVSDPGTNFKSYQELDQETFSDVVKHQDLYNTIRLCSLLTQNKFLHNGETNLVSESLAKIGSCVYVDKIPCFTYDFKRNKFVFSRGFAVDNKNFIIDILRNPIKTSLKIDSIVKSTKTKDIPSSFKKAVKKVKESSNNHLHAPFNIESDDFSVITKENDFFKTLFKEDNENIYSNVDLFLNKKLNSIKYDSLVESKSKDIFSEVETEDLKRFVQSYYKKSNFDSSSSLYLNILKSIEKESRLFDNINTNMKNIQDRTLLQLIYFNYIYYNNNSEVLDTISKRFIKKAILESNFSKDNISTKEFKYDYKSFDEKDYDITNRNEIKRYVDDVMSSSPSLELIRKNVFDIENIRSIIRNNCNYSTINNIDISDRRIIFLENKLIFPYTFYFKYFYIQFNSNDAAYNNVNVEKITSVDTRLKTKNSISKRTLRSGQRIFNPFTQEIIEFDDREDALNEYFILDTNNAGFNCTKSSKINASISFENSMCIDNENIGEKESYKIVDNFESICDNKNYVFNNIVSLIRDILEGHTEGVGVYKNEKEIDDFIQSNNSLIDTVKQIMIVYSELYLVYFSRIQRNVALNNFSWVEDKRSSGLKDTLRHSNFQSIIPSRDFNFSKVYEVSNVKEKLKSLSSSRLFLRDSLYDRLNSKDLTSDFKVLINNIERNTDMFLKDEIDMSSVNLESEWKSEVTETLYNVFGILVKSDVNQAMSMDFIVLMINYLDKIKDLTYEEMSDNGLLSIVSDIIGKDNIDQIKQKIYNPIFVNALASKSLSFLEKNVNLHSDLQSLENQSLATKYDDVNIYKYLKDLNKENISKVKDDNITKLVSTQITGVDGSGEIINKETGDIRYTNSNSNFYKSDYHTFNLQISEIFNLSPDSLVLININLVDHENLNRVYLPKTLIFSPLLTFNKFNNVEEFIFYNIFSNTLFDRLIKVSYEELKNPTESSNIKDYFNSLIKKKKPNIVEQNQNFAEKLYEYILKCHLGSGQISLINRGVNAIDFEYAKNGNTETTQEIVDLFSSLDDLSFYNTFNITKEESIKHMTKQENDWNLPTVIKSFSLGTTFFENCKALCDIVGTKELKNINNVVYDTYNVHVNPKDFIFFELYGDSPPLDEFKIYLSNSEESLLKLYGFNTGILTGKNLYSNIDIENDNYSIEINYEII